MGSDRLAVLVPITSRRCGFASPRSRETSNAQDQNSTDLHEDRTSNETLKAVLSGLRTLAASLRFSSPKLNDGSRSQRSATDGHRDGADILILLGIDADDTLLLPHKQDCVDVFNAAGVPVEVLMLKDHAPGELCRIWSQMAEAAVNQFGCNLTVLLGDDTEVTPPGWPDKVLTTFHEQPELMLLLLNDGADPGFPSFPVLRVNKHLEIFNKLLPDGFINQGGDPYLAALYRRWYGCVAMLLDVTVVNKVGGVQRSEQPYMPPRYNRHTVNKETMLNELKIGTAALQKWRTANTRHSSEAARCFIDGLDPYSSSGSSRQSKQQTAPAGQDDCEPADQCSSGGGGSGPKSRCFDNGAAAVCATESSTMDVDDRTNNDKKQPQLISAPSSPAEGYNTAPAGRQLAVDVLVPSYRVDVNYLQGIADAVLKGPNIPGCDLQLIIVVDQPACNISTEQKKWLQQLQEKHLHKVRIRFHEENMGASATRNTALQESLAEYVIFWDDDITPRPGCVAAYVQAMKNHPQARGFVGPSYVTKDPSSVWSCAVHQADVLFFWDAAEDWQLAEVVPWAVTANVALINTATEFDLCFPKTGGGEDIDYCLKVAGGQLVPVKVAAVHHSLWNNGRRRYSRFFGWAYGDGALIAMYPNLCYYNWPNSAEAVCLLLLLSAVASFATAGAAVWRAATAVLPTAVATHGLVQYCKAATLSAVRSSMMCVAAAVGYKAVDLLLDVLRAFHPVRTAKHPCSTAIIRLAAATEASLIKTWSEAGRLWGLMCRRELLPDTALLFPPTGASLRALLQPGVCQRFDWFCGLAPAVVTAEKRRGFWRLVACCAGTICGVLVADRMLYSIIGWQVVGVDELQGGGVALDGMMIDSSAGEGLLPAVLTSAAVVAGCAARLWRMEA